jgi:hypothetical protein
MRMRLFSYTTAALALVAGCASSRGPGDVGLDGLAVDQIDPGIVIPGTMLQITGESFIPDEQGSAVLHLVGTANGDAVDADWPATFVDYAHMRVEVDAGFIDEIGGDVDFEGDATLEVLSIEAAGGDGEVHISPPTSVSLEFRHTLTPGVTSILSGTVIYVNDYIEVDGSGFLLGGTEGQTVAVVDGCFDDGGGCVPVSPVEVPAAPRAPFSRTQIQFPFKPQIAGIRPGSFIGTVTIRNEHDPEHGTGDVTSAAPNDVDYELIESQITRINPMAASLGQYVFVEGGGFVGGEPGASTDIHLVGTFTPTGAPGGAPVDMTLIPEFVDGKLVRYVLNEDDALGQAIDLRQQTGTFVGSVEPIITFGGDQVVGFSRNVTLAIAPVKQVVYLNFMPTYIEGLREFGLRAVHLQIRDRIIAVANRAYEAVNIEFRTEPPTDFAQFSQVDLAGVDPQNTGLFGYDNTPGKDNGNLRLYDRIGGVNAATQQDGYPGFGGVFLKSLLGFSLHPPDGIMGVPGADPVFDKIFDPFRPDRGDVITSDDLSDTLEPVTDGTGCPSTDRHRQIECAIYVMGNLVGGTTSHELGHSLGLANPYAEGFHNAGDAPNRLMDAGGDRPFLERAELDGFGPGVFCDDEYNYLRMILPSSDPPSSVSRPSCF